VNADLVRGLIRMGFYVGVHTEHGHDAARYERLVTSLAAPVIAAMSEGGKVAESPICGANKFPRTCIRPPGHPGVHHANDGFTWWTDDDTAEPPVCGPNGPKTCVRPPGHSGHHLSNSGTQWPNEREG